MTKVRSRRSRKKKRFDAASIPALFPKTLKKGRRKSGRARNATRKRKKSFFTRLGVRSWGLSHYFSLLLIVGSIIAGVFLFTDSRFIVPAPAVSESGYIDAGLVQRQADIANANIFTIDPGHVAMRLTTVLPQVKTARVRLGLPNRAIIHVIAREPILIYGRNAQTQWVDAEGHIFPAAGARQDLPVLIDEDGSASTDGQHLDPALWQAIQQIKTSIPSMNEFHYRGIYGLFFISPEGWRVYLGDGENMQNKLNMWQTLRQQILQENRQIKTIDLRHQRVYIQ